MESPSSELDRIHENGLFRVYPQRFWVLFVFCFLSFNQCMFWLTFSPIASSTESFYHVSEATVDLLLNWGPIIFLPTLPLTYLILNTHHGLRKCVLIFAIVSLIATVIRLIPSIVMSSTDPHFHDLAVPFLHIGQILIAATGPIGMALVSQLSCLWFAPHERTRATTINVLSTSFGGAVSFLISPHLVSEPWRVPHLLYLHAGQALLACIFTLAYYPAEPPSPPSAAAHIRSAERFRIESLTETLKRFLHDILHCCKDISCVLLILSGALMGGTLSAWGGLFATILAPLGYSENDAGWFGFGQSIAGIVGGLAMGFIADLPRFQRSLKSLMLISLTFSFISCLLFQLSIRTMFWPDHPPLPSSVISIVIILSINGFFNGAGSPLIYECLAEMMHPLPESLTASIFVQLFNVVSLIFLAIAPNRAMLMNLLVLLMMTIGIIMVACARVTYKRKDDEQKKEKTLPISE
ncbi:unnamed protein product [Adineta steineri]|uniref:Uncharacterized protein n=1 Tax=Adineta steineri TaxID=433720 RepID=A0A818ICH3_9BILA|nr:unnamed protein product [Adineta steineri]CAF3520156.1 unnamed protein product [Adineta steineri]